MADQRVANITCGSSGIGRATVLALAKEGVKIVMAARRAKEGEETVRVVKKAGSNGIFVKTWQMKMMSGYLRRRPSKNTIGPRQEAACRITKVDASNMTNRRSARDCLCSSVVLIRQVIFCPGSYITS